MSNDIVIDTLERLVQILQSHGVPVQRRLVCEAERVVKLDWGGDRPYVPRAGESSQAQMSQRDQMIFRDHRRGEHTGLLARRYCLSVRRVQQILRLHEHSETACLTDCAAPGQDADHDADRPEQRASRSDGRRHRQVAKEPV
jgi:Mor family transcriptional regulator